MPTHPPHQCGAPTCPELVARGQPYCPTHTRPETVRADHTRGSASERGYGSRWSKARKGYLQSHPLCVKCLALGRTTAARVVDHVVAHRGDMKLFWDPSNWQSLCDYRSAYNCHGKKRDSEERGEVVPTGVRRQEG